jgi:hypothetical protein
MSTPPKHDPLVPLKAESFTLKDAIEPTWFKTKMKMYIVNEDRLNNLMAGYDSLNWLFFGICFGAGVSVGIACIETGSYIARAAYLGVLAACVIGIFFFGIRGKQDYDATKEKREKFQKEFTPLDFIPAETQPPTQPDSQK